VAFFSPHLYHINIEFRRYRFVFTILLSILCFFETLSYSESLSLNVIQIVSIYIRVESKRRHDFCSTNLKKIKHESPVSKIKKDHHLRSLNVTLLKITSFVNFLCVSIMLHPNEYELNQNLSRWWTRRQSHFSKTQRTERIQHCFLS